MVTATLWYEDFGFWCCFIGFVWCLGSLTRAGQWWDGLWRAGEDRWVNRGWLTAVLALLMITLTTMIVTYAESDGVVLAGTEWTLRGMYILGFVLAGVTPLVACWTAFDFAVPPGMRGREPSPPPGPNRAERRARARQAERMRRRRDR